MTIEEINKRIEAILALQMAFDSRVVAAENALLIETIAAWTDLQEKLFPTFKKLWNAFLEKEYIPLIDSFIADMNQIVKLNEAYFGESVPTTLFYERLGVSEAGVIVREGYAHTILQDQSAKRELQQFVSRTKQLKFDQKVKEDVTKLIKGTPATPQKPASPGIIQKFTDQNVKDTYQEADRTIQQDYADVHFLDAGMYTGGIIENTRPFCKERNRKVFLRNEIALFGTSEDKWGGYIDKSEGTFSGKPKTGYDPFTQCGGYRCRHHWSWLANEFATRMDKTLKEGEDGKLFRVAS